MCVCVTSHSKTNIDVKHAVFLNFYTSSNDIYDFFLQLVTYLAKGAGTEAK